MVALGDSMFPFNWKEREGSKIKGLLYIFLWGFVFTSLLNDDHASTQQLLSSGMGEKGDLGTVYIDIKGVPWRVSLNNHPLPMSIRMLGFIRYTTLL